MVGRERREVGRRGKMEEDRKGKVREGGKERKDGGRLEGTGERR